MAHPGISYVATVLQACAQLQRLRPGRPEASGWNCNPEPRRGGARAGAGGQVGGAGRPGEDAGPIKCSLPPRRRSSVGRVLGGLAPSGVRIAAGVCRSQSPRGSRLRRRVSASFYPLPHFTPQRCQRAHRPRPTPGR